MESETIESPTHSARIWVDEPVPGVFYGDVCYWRNTDFLLTSRKIRTMQSFRDPELAKSAARALASRLLRFGTVL